MSTNCNSILPPLLVGAQERGREAAGEEVAGSSPWDQRPQPQDSEESGIWDVGWAGLGQPGGPRLQSPSGLGQDLEKTPSPSMKWAGRQARSSSQGPRRIRPGTGGAPAFPGAAMVGTWARPTFLLHHFFPSSPGRAVVLHFLQGLPKGWVCRAPEGRLCVDTEGSGVLAWPLFPAWLLPGLLLGSLESCMPG